MSIKLDVALAYPAILGEGPVWDDRKNVLFWIDSLADKAFMFNPSTGENREYELGQNVGTLVLTERDDAVLVGLVDGLYELNLTSGSLVKKADPEPDLPGNRLNDGKPDPAGRLWIGSMCIADNGVEGFDTDYKCNLHRIDADYSCHVMDPEVRLSNGMAWSEDKKTFYYIDSPTFQIYAYDFDADEGTISNRRACVEFPEDMGVGDGMDIDADGNLWVAHWGGWAVLCWDPRTGKLLHKIDVPVCRVASCAFGGENYDKLYIVTASVNTDKDDKEQPEAGYLFVAENLGTTGLPFNRFKG